MKSNLNLIVTLVLQAKAVVDVAFLVSSVAVVVVVAVKAAVERSLCWQQQNLQCLQLELLMTKRQVSSQPRMLMWSVSSRLNMNWKQLKWNNKWQWVGFIFDLQFKNWRTISLFLKWCDPDLDQHCLIMKLWSRFIVT